MPIGPRLIPTPQAGGLDAPRIIKASAHRMMYSTAKEQHTASDFDVYQALAFAVRDRVMERWFRTQSTYYHRDVKRVHYLSLKFLMGRALAHNVISLGAEDAYTEAQERVSATYADSSEWARKSILNVAGMGKCSIDRTVREYARDIWKAPFVPVPLR